MSGIELNFDATAPPARPPLIPPVIAPTRAERPKEDPEGSDSTYVSYIYT